MPYTENEITKNLPVGNMAHGIDGVTLTQSSEGIHKFNPDSDTCCGELLLNFNINAVILNGNIVIEMYKNETYIYFCSDDFSIGAVSKCMDEALDYLSVKLSHVAALIRSILLSLVGIVLFNEEEACTLSCQQRAFEMFGK